jgi:hypothetical protein
MNVAVFADPLHVAYEESCKKQNADFVASMMQLSTDWKLVQALDVAGSSNGAESDFQALSIEEIASLMQLSSLMQLAQAGAAAGPSNATYARVLQDEHLVQQLDAPAAPRQMSPSNGAAATAAPAGPRLLDEENMTIFHMCEVFGVKEIKRPEYQEKLKATLRGFRAMKRIGVIDLVFGAERSIFGMTDIIVKDQVKWIEMMTHFAKSYTKEQHREKKKYQQALYHMFNMLGFSGIGRSTDAWTNAGEERIHICFDVWHYNEELFQRNKGRFICR